MLRDHLGRFSTDTKVKLAWIGKRLFFAAAVILIGSMLLEWGIYAAGHKVADMYTSQFVSFK